MKRRQSYGLHLVCLLLLLSPFTNSAPDYTKADKLDTVIRDQAFRALLHKHTGHVYPVPLPMNLTGITASVLRIRSGKLWLHGAKIGPFVVPPGTLSVPPVRRLVFVSQDLGNRSNTFYRLEHFHNYELAGPVLGLSAYDADRHHTGRTGKLGFNLTGGPIIVRFPEIKARGLKCIAFEDTGTDRIEERRAGRDCTTGSGGHFSIVRPVDMPVAPAPSPGPRKRKRWVVLVAALAGGVVVLVAVGVAVARVVRRRREVEMRRRSDEGEVLEDVWVSGNKMPSASMMRTQPGLEHGSAP